MRDLKRWWIVVVYAAAMAWVEAAVVFYLRSMVDRIEPYQANPLPLAEGFGLAELVREAATLVMLTTVALLAGRSWRSRAGYWALAFGVWDILYYIFLRLLCGWPHSLMDWDILFLLPLPWWGPVLAPVAIATLMILWGTLASQEPTVGFGWAESAVSWTLCLLGGGLALYAFMADALRVAGGGAEAMRNLLPTKFSWGLFGLAWLLMAAPAFEAIRHRLATQTAFVSCMGPGRPRPQQRAQEQGLPNGENLSGTSRVAVPEDGHTPESNGPRARQKQEKTSEHFRTFGVLYFLIL